MLGNANVIARPKPLSKAFIRRLQSIVGASRVFTKWEDLLSYSYDGTLFRAAPQAVVLPSSKEAVTGCVAAAYEEGIPIVPRGAASGLSGGSVPAHGGLVIDLTSMNSVISLDQEQRLVTVEAGYITTHLHRLAESHHLFYPPDPASSDFSTIGGNIAEGAGGPRGYKYGTTIDYVAGLEIVVAAGQQLTLRGPARGGPGGPMALMVGSEGTLGIITAATLNLIPLPEATGTLLAVFDTLQASGQAIEAIVSSGVVPSTLEILDQSAIQCVESYQPSGLPRDAAAVLLIEVDGLTEAVTEESEKVSHICRAAGATSVRRAADERERAELWRARKAVSPSTVRIKPGKIVEDATVPRSRITDMIMRTREIGEKHRLATVIYGHAGDGNLHPNFIVDPQDHLEIQRAEEAIRELFEAAWELGGTLSGEHGIGLAKKDYLQGELGPTEMALTRAVKRALDPEGLFNPGKFV